MHGMKVKILKDGRAKKALIEFGKLEIGAEMLALTDPGDGDAFVQRMRVRMSRVRGKIKQAKLNPTQFTMRLMKIEKVMLSGIEYDQVTIKKTKNGLTDVQDLLDSIEPFGNMVSGGIRR